MSDWLIPLLLASKSAPAVYIGGLTIERMAAFCEGYRLARMDSGFPAYGDEETPIIKAFEEWLKKQTHLPDATWATHVAALDSSAENIRSLYRLFFEFVAETGIDLSRWSSRASWPKWMRGGNFAD